MNTTLNLNIMSDSQIHNMGIEALKEKLGVVGTIRFLEQFDNGGDGNYTKEKYKEQDISMNKEEILEMFKS